MNAIILQCADGARHLAFVAPASFDVQAWAERRRAAFARLAVVRVIVETVEAS